MKIVMFTPALQASAIGRMARLVTAALLADGHSVVVVRAESASLASAPQHPFGTETVHWIERARVRELVAEADLVAYQMGNCYEFHEGCLEWLAEAPGVICLHDYFLGHLFWGWAAQRRAQAEAILESWYGADVAQRFFRHGNSESFIDDTHVSAPMTEWLSSLGTAVLTHSSWGIERVLRSCAGPVRVAALPYDAPEASAPRENAQQDNTLRVLTVGHVNPNKRVASVIRAIGSSDILRQITIYRLVGAIVPATVMSLSSLARNSQVNLVISDEVEGAVLNSALNEADVITCLRYPSLEAASASAIEAMLYGKPVIVTDTNFYSEIPDDCVLKIDADNEVEALQQTLERLHADPALRAELGARGQRWARDTFRADSYAAQLIAIGADAARAAPVLDALAALTATLGNWGGSADLLHGEHTLGPLALFNHSNPG